MHSVRTAVFILLISLLASTVSAKEKDRQWQTGKVLDTDRSRVYVGEVGSASGSATTNGNTTSGQANGSATAVYRVYVTYTIEAGDYVYVCQEHIRWKWSKPADVTVNGPVQFAIAKDHLYIKGEDGSEHETKIIKKVSRAQQPMSANTQSGRTTSSPDVPAPQTPPSEKGSIEVSSLPDGADVYVDGAFLGNTPATLKLREGKHTIRVKLEGFKEWSREISVLSGSDVKLTASLEKAN